MGSQSKILGRSHHHAPIVEKADSTVNCVSRSSDMSFCERSAIINVLGGRKCFSEDFDAGMTAQCDFHAAGRNGTFDLDLTVWNAQNKIEVRRPTFTHEKFSFRIPPTHRKHSVVRRYEFCVQHTPKWGEIRQYAEMIVTFHVEQQDRRKLAMLLSNITLAARLEKRAAIKNALLKFREIEKEMNKMIVKFDELRDYEQSLAHENVSMAETVIRTSFLTCAYIVFVGLSQSEAHKILIWKKKRQW